MKHLKGRSSKHGLKSRTYKPLKYVSIVFMGEALVTLVYISILVVVAITL